MASRAFGPNGFLTESIGRDTTGMGDPNFTAWRAWRASRAYGPDGPANETNAPAAGTVKQIALQGKKFHTEKRGRDTTGIGDPNFPYFKQKCK